MRFDLNCSIRCYHLHESKPSNKPNVTGAKADRTTHTNEIIQIHTKYPSGSQQGGLSSGWIGHRAYRVFSRWAGVLCGPRIHCESDAYVCNLIT